MNGGGVFAMNPGVKTCLKKLIKKWEVLSK